jgi:hypothetical protein
MHFVIMLPKRSHCANTKRKWSNIVKESTMDALSKILKAIGIY